MTEAEMQSIMRRDAEAEARSLRARAALAASGTEKPRCSVSEPSVIT